MQTLLMLKPDTVANGHTGRIIDLVTQNRFKISDLRMFSFDRASAERFYAIHRERDFFPDLIAYMTSGPVVALKIDGPEVVERIRAFIGPTDPAKASPGSIRYMYGSSIQNNAVHASDSPESAKKELAIVFGGS